MNNINWKLVVALAAAAVVYFGWPKSEMEKQMEKVRKAKADKAAADAAGNETTTT